MRTKCFPEIAEELPILREGTHLELCAYVFEIVRVAELEPRVREIPKHCGLQCLGVVADNYLEGIVAGF